jgi:hypothetical protein
MGVWGSSSSTSLTVSLAKSQCMQQRSEIRISMNLKNILVEVKVQTPKEGTMLR